MSETTPELAVQQRTSSLVGLSGLIHREPGFWSARDAAKFALLQVMPSWLASLLPFTLPEGDKWVQLLDDGEPECKRIEVSNTGDTPIEVEVTYTDEQESGTHPPFRVPPHSSMLIECHVGKLRVRGAGGKGVWDTPADPTWIIVHGSGPAYHHGPSLGEVLGFHCKTFHITNTGKSPIKAKYTRLTPPTAAQPTPPDEKKEEEVLPGNTLVIRCKIVSIDIVGPEDAVTRVEEVEK